MAAITTETIKNAATVIAANIDGAGDILNEADGKLGDGDLGITVVNGWKEIDQSVDSFPEDVGMALLECSKAFQRASSSSFGTLVATAFMSCAKECKGNEEIPWGRISDLLAKACEGMMARGKGQLGDKSVLDVMDAMARAADGLDSPDKLLEAISLSVDQTLEEYRDKPSRLGRARMFGEKSIGLDDPGMLAVQQMVRALKS